MIWQVGLLAIWFIGFQAIWFSAQNIKFLC
jgi:hypothetical protein